MSDYTTVTVSYRIKVTDTPSDGRLTAMVAFGKNLLRRVTDDEFRMMADELLRWREADRRAKEHAPVGPQSATDRSGENDSPGPKDSP